MKPPHLNRRLVLEAPVRAADGSGGFSVGWVALGALWAEVSANGGVERQVAGVAVSRVGYRIVVRGAPATDEDRHEIISSRAHVSHGDRIGRGRAVAG